MKKAKRKARKPHACPAQGPLRFRAPVQVFEAFPMHYVALSSAQVKKLGGKFLVRLVCTLNGKLSYQCALQGLGNGGGWIGINKIRMKELGLKIGVKVAVELKPDHSKYGLPMPEELEELLRQDEEGQRRFEALSPGKQRNILHYVGNHKNTDKRLDRAVTVIDNLKRLELGRETAAAILGIKSIRP